MPKNTKRQAKGAEEKSASRALLAAVRNAKKSEPTTPVGALKLKEARAYLGGLSVPTMHRLMKRGLLRPCRQVRHLIFSLKELTRFLEDGLE